MINTMSNFDKEFIMELFLESDNVSSMNRVVVAMANVVKENHDTLTTFSELNIKEFNQKNTFNGFITNFVTCRSRAKGFYEKTILCYTDEEFFQKFKMKKSTVQALIIFLKKCINPGNIPLDKKVHIFLWYLINDYSYSDIGKLFGIHKSTISNIFNEIGSQLLENKHCFMSWPSIEDQHATRIKVNSRMKFPNCVGFIDACRFKVASRCKKRIPVIILLQAVCNESLMFIDIHVGDLGRSKKNKLFKESPLSQILTNVVDFDNHILGSSEYKLKNNLITPFTSEELLTSEEMKFNELHWKARSYIGYAFELLKERFRKLNYIDIVKQESVQLLIYSSCILHNFILMHEGSSQIKEETVFYDDGVHVVINHNIVKKAIEKRQFLCNYINYMNADSS